MAIFERIVGRRGSRGLDRDGASFFSRNILPLATLGTSIYVASQQRDNSPPGRTQGSTEGTSGNRGPKSSNTTLWIAAAIAGVAVITIFLVLFPAGRRGR